jgi:ubiquinone/menaquinone biosynthesis C-methylase UbiE
VSLPRFYEDLWELSTTDVALSVDWVREGYVRSVVREAISPRQAAGPLRLGDIGCGTGAYLREFARRSDLDFLGFDVSSRALLQCRKWLTEEEESRCLGLVQGDGASLSLSSSSFDLLFCAHVLEHVPQDEATLAELHRVLRTGGYLRLVVPNTLDRMLPLFRPLERRLGSLGHLREYTPEELKRQLEAHGFLVHRTFCTDFLLAWVLFRVEETMRSMTRRWAWARSVNRLVSRRRIVCRALALASGTALYWENRLLRGRSWGMNLCCIAERAD